MRLALLALVIAVPGSALAVDFVDPDGIASDAPDMLVLEKLFVSCSESGFGISANRPIGSTTRINVPEMAEHSLSDEPLRITAACQHGNRSIEALLEAQPPGETGMCSATHSARVRIRVNNKLLLSSWFANYCTGWGLTSVHASGSPSLAYLTVCGYWSVPSERFEKGGSVKTFKCEKFPLDKMHEQGLIFVDGEISQ